MDKRISILFICMGNYCRSPAAEAVAKAYVAKRGWEERFLIDSAGTHSYHLRKPPDPRMQHEAELRGYDMSGIRARIFCNADLNTFDYIFAMDKKNLADLSNSTSGRSDGKVKLLLGFSEKDKLEIADPYYGDAGKFSQIFVLIEKAVEKGLRKISKEFTKM